MTSVVVDTGVWYALCDPSDRVASDETLELIESRLDTLSVIVPWPIAYETLRTKFVRKRVALEQFERKLKSPQVTLVDDSPYREDAFALSIESSLRGHRPLSMVDCVIRMLLDDTNVRIRYLATFNVGDFADVCAKRQIEVLCQ